MQQAAVPRQSLNDYLAAWCAERGGIVDRVHLTIQTEYTGRIDNPLEVIRAHFSADAAIEGGMTLLRVQPGDGVTTEHPGFANKRLRWEVVAWSTDSLELRGRTIDAP